MNTRGRYLIVSILALVVCWLLYAPDAHTQAVYGTFLGTVQDQQGALIPNAPVSAKNLETGVLRATTTDHNGSYRIADLLPGSYHVTVSARGFNTEVRNDVNLTVGAETKLDFVLRVGTAGEEVTVSGEPPQLNTTNASMGGVIEDREVRQLPLNGRDWLQLAELQAGVIGGIAQPSAANYSNSRAARGNGTALDISGNRPTGNVFLIDGLVVNDYANASPGSGLNVNLGVDAVREFRVVTNEATAEYGRSTGGVVTAVFKSGTNQFHGSVYEFLRNSAFDARNYFDAQKPQFQRNQFGGSAGGPIVRDRTFIFGDYEELHENKGIPHQSDTLSPDARNGLVCKSVGSNPCGTKVAVPIAASIRPYLAFFPLSNGPINGDSAKYIFAGKRIGVERYGMVKVDHNFSPKTMLAGSYQIDDTDESQPDPYNQKRTGSPSRHQNGVITLQHVFSPNFENTVVGGVSRTHATDSLDVSAIDPIAANKSLGFFPNSPAGTLVVGGLTGTQGGLGASGSDILNYTSFQGGDDASWLKGHSTFKFGGHIERIRYNKDSLVGAPLGEFDFDSVAQFLQGIPSQFTADVPGTSDVRGLRQFYQGVYFEDSVALRRNLRMDAGMRYEHVSPITEQFGRVAVLPTLASPTPRTGGAYFSTNTKNFAPRLAFAWSPGGDGKTSIRTGFGMFDLLPFPYLMENRTNSAPFFEEGTVTTPPPSAFPTGGLALLTPTTFRGSYVQSHPHRAYSMQWNLSVQRQLAADMVLTLGYVGSRANHLPRSIEDADQVPPNLVKVSADGHLLFPTNPALKKGGPIPRINPNFGRIATTVWDDFSTYHSLVADFDKRFGHGFLFKAAYTWSKSIDEGSNTFSDNETTNTSGVTYAFFPQLQRAVSDFDVAHRLVLTYSWAVPTPGSFHGATKALLAGWQLGGIFSAQTGPPFTVTLKNDQARTGDSRVGSSSGGQRPNYNPAPGCSPNAVNPGNPLTYVKLQCFSFPPLGELGNLGRNTLRGPGLQNFDASLFKNWPLWREQTSLQFRVEAFNVLNHANFQEPKTKIFDGSGNLILVSAQIPSPTATPERQIQFALKLTW
jgi:hypothetical protein